MRTSTLFLLAGTLVTSLLLENQAHAQMPLEPATGCKVRYIYDQAGNRTKREWYCWTGGGGGDHFGVNGGAGKHAEGGLLEANSLRTAPNPASEVLSLQLATVAEGAVVAVTDLQGRVLMTQPMRSDRMELPIADLSNGTYAVRVTVGSEMLMTTFIVLH
jgi:Secretion system C-terminal sorting domain